MRGANQKFAERDEVVKLPQIQARSGQEGVHAAVQFAAIHIAVELVASHFGRQSEEAAGVVRESAIGAMVVEIGKRGSGTEVYLAVAASEFVSGHHLSGCVVAAFISFGRGLGARKWCFLRNR